MTEPMPWRLVAIAVFPCFLFGIAAWALDNPLASVGACSLAATWAIGIHERWVRESVR